MIQYSALVFQDTLGVLFALAGLILYVDRRLPQAGVLMAFASLTKETFIPLSLFCALHLGLKERLSAFAAARRTWPLWVGALPALAAVAVVTIASPQGVTGLAQHPPNVNETFVNWLLLSSVLVPIYLLPLFEGRYLATGLALLYGGIYLELATMGAGMGILAWHLLIALALEAVGLAVGLETALNMAKRLTLVRRPAIGAVGIFGLLLVAVTVPLDFTIENALGGTHVQGAGVRIYGANFIRDWHHHEQDEAAAFLDEMNPRSIAFVDGFLFFPLYPFGAPNRQIFVVRSSGDANETAAAALARSDFVLVEKHDEINAALRETLAGCIAYDNARYSAYETARCLGRV